MVDRHQSIRRSTAQGEATDRSRQLRGCLLLSTAQLLPTKCCPLHVNCSEFLNDKLALFSSSNLGFTPSEDLPKVPALYLGRFTLSWIIILCSNRQHYSLFEQAVRPNLSDFCLSKIIISTRCILPLPLPLHPARQIMQKIHNFC